MEKYFEMGPYSAQYILNDVWHIHDATKSNPPGEHADGHFNNPSSIYLIEDEAKVLLIDTGNPHEPGTLRAVVNQIANGRTIEVAITHNHFDHIGQRSDFSDCTIYLPVNDFPGENDPHVRYVRDGQHIKFNQHEWICIETPGHTQGSMSFYDPKAHLLATGDAFGSSYVWLLFIENVLDTYALTLQKMLNVLKDDDQVEFLCGHRYQQQITPIKGINPLSPANPHMTKQYLHDMQILVSQIQKGTAEHHAFEAFGRKDDLAAYTYGQAEIDTYIPGSSPIQI